MATIKKETQVDTPKISAGSASLLTNVGDKEQFEIRVIKVEVKEFKSKKEEGVINKAWEFNSIIRDASGKDLLNAAGKATFLKFLIFYGKKGMKPNFNYGVLRNIVFPELSVEEKELLTGTELLNGIKKHPGFLVTIEAAPAFISQNGVEYANYSYVSIENSMLSAAILEQQTEEYGLWED